VLAHDRVGRSAEEATAQVAAVAAAVGVYLSLRTPPESRANRTGDRPTVLVKAVLNALADP
jgi:hypothetical protein